MRRPHTIIGEGILRLSMLAIASENLTDEYTDREREKNQRRTRQGYAPEEKRHLKVVVCETDILEG